MLKKEDMAPGTRVIVNAKIVDGLPAAFRDPGPEPLREHLTVWADGEKCGMGAGWNLPPGYVLEVVKGPRKRGNINLIRVKFDEHLGEVYWCHLRASCRLA